MSKFERLSEEDRAIVKSFPRGEARKAKRRELRIAAGLPVQPLK